MNFLIFNTLYSNITTVIYHSNIVHGIPQIAISAIILSASSEHKFPHPYKLLIEVFFELSLNSQSHFVDSEIVTIIYIPWNTVLVFSKYDTD